jgi:hypothetical protein
MGLIFAYVYILYVHANKLYVICIIHARLHAFVLCFIYTVSLKFIGENCFMFSRCFNCILQRLTAVNCTGDSIIDKTCKKLKKCNV